jgi:hypothetical protein
MVDPFGILKDGGIRLNLAVGYFDESTDEDTEGYVYTIAGFIASQQSTVVLELRWRDLLTKYDLAYFKASELNAMEGEFKKFRDHPERIERALFSDREKVKQQEIKTAFTDCIVSCSGLFGIGASIILPDYKRLLREYAPAKYVLELPYYVCLGFVLSEAGSQMYTANESLHNRDKACLQPVFDSHEGYSGRAKLGFDLFRAHNGDAAKYLLPPNYESETDYLALQAADEFAFEVRKLLSNTYLRPGLNERIPMTRLKASGRVARIYKLDYAALKDFIDVQDEAYANRYRPIQDSLWEMRDIFLERVS